MSCLQRLCALVAAMTVFGNLSVARAEKTAADLLPKSTLFYAEINRPKETLAAIADHPLRKVLEGSEAYRKAIGDQKFQQFLAVVGVVERRSGMPWRQAVETIAGERIVFAFEPSSKGIVILTRPADMKASDRLRDTLFELARGDAQNKGQPDPISSKTYRDFTAYQAGEAIIADVGPWLLMSNKPELARAVADSYLDGGEALSEDPAFAETHRAAAAQATPPSAWAYLRLEPLRVAGMGGALLSPTKEKSPNPAAELLLGGLAPTLQKAPFVTASAWVGAEGTRLSIAAPSDRAWVPAERKFFFATPPDGAAPPLLPKDVMLSVTTYRDLAALWQAGPDLFDEAVATKLAQADSQLSTLFGGKSFSADVLGAVNPQLQFVVAKQAFDKAATPATPLPARR